MGGMEYIIPLALLVAVAAWLTAVFHRLNHLYGQVQSAWMQWSHATRQRNECLGDFTAVFSGYLPQGDMLPRDLRRLTEDSQRALSSSPQAPMAGAMGAVGEAERALRRVVGDSVQTLESSAPMRENQRLLQLCSQMSVTLFQQEQMARSYNRLAADYNQALSAPSGRLVGGIFGFLPVDSMGGAGA